ncbi:MAG: methyltransferase domain-containing protein [Pseudomonadota bacterium]
MSSQVDTLSETETNNLQQAAAACRAITQEIDALETDLAAALQAVGCVVEPAPDLRPSADGSLQFHRAALRVSREDLPKAATVLEEHGFRAPFALTEGRMAAIARFSPQVQMVRFDDVTTRVLLAFREPIPSHLPNALRPNFADFARADFAKPLIGAYAISKLVRVFQERAFGRRAAAHEMDFLGTPDALIAPILAPLKLTESDVFADIGCGDGRVVLQAARSGCQAIGIEHSADLATRAQQNANKSPDAARIKILSVSAEDADLSAVTVAFLFMPAHILGQLLPKILPKFQPGTRLVVHEQARQLPGLTGAMQFPVIDPKGITVLHVVEL